MLYCENCMILLDSQGCPECKNKNLRPPKGNDPVLVLSKEALWSGGIEEALREHDIPYLKQGAQGSAFNVILGSFGERYRYYVPHAALEQARELLADFVHSEDGQGDEAEEFDHDQSEE